jgi:hypothetical protein
LDIGAVDRQVREGEVRLEALLRQTQLPDVRLYFAFQTPDPETVGLFGEPFAAAILPWAMARREPLRVAQPLSPQFAFSLPRVRDIFHTWWPRLFASVELDLAAQAERGPPPQPRGATFFSGGVDSFYSLLKNRRSPPGGVPLTHLVFMRGVETRLYKARGVYFAEAWVREVAEAIGVQAVVGESNVREVVRLHWEDHLYGAALAAIALCLQRRLGYVCIPSGYAYNDLCPHGSTPLVDEMFSTESLSILHDGAERPRPEKLAAIIGWEQDLVLQHLRVCIENHGGAFNCGECYKCVRTAVPLVVLGVWDKANFRNKGREHWDAVISADHAALTRENLRFARARGAERWLLDMLERALKTAEAREAGQSAVRAAL